MNNKAAPSYRVPVDAVVRRAVIRLGLVILLCMAVAVVYWTWSRLRPVNEKLVAATDRLSALVDKAQQMDQRWDGAEAARIEAAFIRATDALFTQKEDFADWQADLEEQSRVFAMDTAVRPGTPKDITMTPPKLAILPVAVDLRVPGRAADSTNTSYAKLLGIGRALGATSKRADVVELVVAGRSNSVEHAYIGYQLWTRGVARP